MTTEVYQPLHLEYLRQDTTVVVRIVGEVDVAASPMLREALVELIDGQGNLSIKLDLEHMTFIDSTGIGVLIGALRTLRRKGGTLTLTNPRPSTVRVLEIAGLTEIFDITVDGRHGSPAA